jgi:alkylation response protein AidB-like acyl-CoA dehydrogenase
MHVMTEEQVALVRTVRQLMDEHATEDITRELDEQYRYPYEIYARFAELGLLSLPFDTELGGGGGSVFDMILATEEIGRKGYDYVAVYGSPVFIGLNIAEHGTDLQKKEFLPELFSGQLRLSVAITEPEAGSDAGSMRTRAVRDGDDYVLNGEKIFISGAAVENTILAVYCLTGKRGDRRGLSCFLIDNTTRGLDIRPLHTLGRHLFPTTQIAFNDVRVPASRMLGELGGGWQVLMSGLQFERIVTSAAYVGNAQGALDMALAYAKQRKQFDRPIGDFQAISHTFADLQTSIEAARLLTYNAAMTLDRGGDAVSEVSMAKLFGSETFKTVAMECVQILGGIGYSMESSMQRHLRNAIGSTITAGTSQMQRQTIARRMGLHPQ